MTDPGGGSVLVPSVCKNVIAPFEGIAVYIRDGVSQSDIQNAPCGPGSIAATGAPPGPQSAAGAGALIDQWPPPTPTALFDRQDLLLH